MLALALSMKADLYTVKPLNNGHSGDRPLVHCREVVPVLDVMPYS